MLRKHQNLLLPYRQPSLEFPIGQNPPDKVSDDLLLAVKDAHRPVVGPN